MSKNWQSLPTAEIAKLCSNGQIETTMGYLKDIKVDARSISDTIDEMNHAVNVFPFQLNSWAIDVKNQQRAINARMEKMEQTLKRIEFSLGNMTGNWSPIPPPQPKKIKLVSHISIT